jgi:hypothetical protein
LVPYISVSNESSFSSVSHIASAGNSCLNLPFLVVPLQLRFLLEVLPPFLDFIFQIVAGESRY